MSQNELGFERAHRRRIWRVLLKAALVCIAVVVLVMVGAVIAIRQATHDPNVHLDEWTLRGGLSGDQALLDRAEQVWRDTGGSGVPDGEVVPLYADRSPSLAVNVVLVALFGHTADERPVVAFVTSPATAGTPSDDQLFVRALHFPTQGSTAVGFVDRESPADAPIPDGGSLAFALSAPGVPDVWIASTVGGDRKVGFTQTFWRIMPPGVGAWNSMISTGASPEPQMWPAAGLRDPVTTTIGKVSSSADGTATATAQYRAPTTGDLVMAQSRLVGVVTDASGRVDFTSATWTAHGEIRVAHTGVPGTVTALPTGHLLFTPTGPGELTEYDQVTLTSAVNPEVVVRVGVLFLKDGRWQVDRPVYPPVAAQEAQVVTPR